ncbi:fibronectin type III domain-containing protein [Polymorphospora rubra]|uniref:Fibronectin type-III domain-containing protein n=1 Tax=Polymorphospora rubra TaxID=338584 RepID=A0A810N7D4_9ACTN|nr:fibronectin type III domain-containing protein [Polymorphospora rubra]BCJ67553.1 hypothetical protein Prubr_45740 [Polymorphospora rubra]
MTYDDRAWYHDPAGPPTEQPWRDDPAGRETGYDDRAWHDDPLSAGAPRTTEAHSNGTPPPHPLSDSDWPDTGRRTPDRPDADPAWPDTAPAAHDWPDPGRPERTWADTDSGWPATGRTEHDGPDPGHPERTWADTDRPEPGWSDTGRPDADRRDDHPGPNDRADRSDGVPQQRRGQDQPPGEDQRRGAEQAWGDEQPWGAEQPWAQEQPWDDHADRTAGHPVGHPEREYAGPTYPQTGADPDAPRRPDLTKPDPTWQEREPALPPDVPGFAPAGADREQIAAAPHHEPSDAHPGVHEVRRTPTTDVAVRRRGDLPVRRPNTLPVPVPRPAAPPPDRRLVPVILAGLVVVALGAVAVIAGFALADRQESTSDADGGQPVPSATGAPVPTGPAAPPPAEPGTPPGGLTVTDNRDSVTLTWTYPQGAEGPVVVSAGRPGQEPRAFQDLPPGTSSYVVYGLNASVDYCFVVAVVYSTDVVGRSEPACTERG